LLGRSDRRRLLAFEWLPGRRLADLCNAQALDRRAVAAAGAALARLHAQEPERLACWTREDEAAYVSALSEEVGFLCPGLAGRADALAQDLAAELAAAPEMHAPVHCDFSPKQVLVGEHGAAIVDFDAACCGDPADDLGNMLAQFEHQALSGMPGVESSREAFLEGYRLGAAAERPGPRLPASRRLPERIALYTALGLLRKSRFPFRAHQPDWPQRTETILARAEVAANSKPDWAE
jgi:Ser/Thr protein kinase RdoA (MazF antagonist)